MRRKLIISDIHGCYEQFVRLLEVAGYDPKNDQLILLGDYVDRGPQSKDVVESVMSLVKHDGAIALRGNHDQRLVDLTKTKDASVLHKFMEHGGRQTFLSYIDSNQINDQYLSIETLGAFFMEHYQHHIAFLDSLPLFYEDETQIFVHAGLNPNYSDWRMQPTRDFMYIKNDFIHFPVRAGKTVVFGHTRAFDIHGTADIWFGPDKIGIDGGCAYGNQLNCLVINKNQDYETYAVQVEM